MSIRSIFAGLSMWIIPGVTYAGVGTVLPEPGVIELLAIAGIVGVATAIRRRRK